MTLKPFHAGCGQGILASRFDCYFSSKAQCGKEHVSRSFLPSRNQAIIDPLCVVVSQEIDNFKHPILASPTLKPLDSGVPFRIVADAN
jgi:hypothetical protein